MYNCIAKFRKKFRIEYLEKSAYFIEGIDAIPYTNNIYFLTS